MAQFSINPQRVAYGHLYKNLIKLGAPPEVAHTTALKYAAPVVSAAKQTVGSQEDQSAQQALQLADNSDFQLPNFGDDDAVDIEDLSEAQQPQTQGFKFPGLSDDNSADLSYLSDGNAAQEPDITDITNDTTLAAEPDAQGASPAAPGSADYASQLQQALLEQDAANKEYGAQLDQLIAQKSQEPSQAELYFKLAQGFLNPGKTGNFSEGLGAAGGAASEYLQQKREIENTDLKRAQELALLKHKYIAGNAGDKAKILADIVRRSGGDNRSADTRTLDDLLKRPKNEQELFFKMKRGQPWVNLGDRYIQPSALDPTRPTAVYGKAPPPQDLPGFKGKVKEAETAAAAQATKQAQQPEINAQINDLQSGIKFLDQAEKSMIAAPKSANQKYPKFKPGFTSEIGSRISKKYNEYFDASDPKLVREQKISNILVNQVFPLLKPLFGPQISNVDAAKLSELSGATPSSPERRYDLIQEFKQRARDQINSQKIKKSPAGSSGVKGRFLGFEGE